MSSDVTVRNVRFISAFPWLRLGQAWGCALAPQQLALACAAVLALTIVDVVLQREATPRAVRFDWQESPSAGLTPLMDPVADVLLPTQAFLSGAPGWWRNGIAAAIAFVVWSIAGVALARSTAIQFGRDENAGLRDVTQFGIQRIAAACGAPLIPLGFAAILFVVVAALALPGVVPALGSLWLLVLSPVLFVLSAAAAVMVVFVPALWPLMIAAIGADDGDAFDAFSRSFSMVASRFWSTLALVFACAVHQFVALVLLSVVAAVTVGLAAWSADWVTGQQSVTTVTAHAAWWSTIVVRGVMASLFWTLATIVYLFLREMVDGVPLSRIAGFDLPVRRHEPYPVVGISAVQPPSGEASVEA